MRYFLITAMVVLAFACSKNRVPKGILTDEEITPVLVELHLAEAIFAQRYALEVTRDNYQEDLYLSILKKYKLDQKTFEASVLYYGKNPVKYKPIYDEVLNRLNEMSAKSRAKDSIQTREINEKARMKDSIQNSKINVKAQDSIQAMNAKDSIKAMNARDSVRVMNIKAKARDYIKAVKTRAIARDTTQTIQ